MSSLKDAKDGLNFSENLQHCHFVILLPSPPSSPVLHVQMWQAGLGFVMTVFWLHFFSLGKGKHSGIFFSLLQSCPTRRSKLNTPWSYISEVLEQKCKRSYTYQLGEQKSAQASFWHCLYWSEGYLDSSANPSQCFWASERMFGREDRIIYVLDNKACLFIALPREMERFKGEP